MRWQLFVLYDFEYNIIKTLCDCDIDQMRNIQIYQIQNSFYCSRNMNKFHLMTMGIKKFADKKIFRIERIIVCAYDTDYKKNNCCINTVLLRAMKCETLLHNTNEKCKFEFYSFVFLIELRIDVLVHCVCVWYVCLCTLSVYFDKFHHDSFSLQKTITAQNRFNKINAITVNMKC